MLRRFDILFINDKCITQLHITSNYSRQKIKIYNFNLETKKGNFNV